MRDQTLWTWHLIAAALIGVLLGMHMGIMHLNEILGWFNRPESRPVDWENVVMRAKMVGFAISYVLLLGAALYHGLYGLRNILFELNPGHGAKKAISGIILVAGLALFVFGTWTAIASYQHAAAGQGIAALQHGQVSPAAPGH
jgi:succinate dehydrogenase hydrophobic anchor subunit